jgi:hypothetical protein
MISRALVPGVSACLLALAVGCGSPARTPRVSHTVYEFASVLRLIEARFNLKPLTTRDTIANSVLDMFDFAQAPAPPLIRPLRSCQ